MASLYPSFQIRTDRNLLPREQSLPFQYVIKIPLPRICCLCSSVGSLWRPLCYASLISNIIIGQISLGIISKLKFKLMWLRGKNSHAYVYKRTTTNVTPIRERSSFMTVNQAPVCLMTEAVSRISPLPCSHKVQHLQVDFWATLSFFGMTVQYNSPKKIRSRKTKMGPCVSLGDSSVKWPDVLLAILSGQQRKVPSFGCVVSFLANASLETELNSLLSLSLYIFHNNPCAIHSWIDELSGLCASVKQRHLTWKSFLQGNRPIWAKSKQD